jgi:deazaflavin-dependent oxidoreductase (nitroreductase family)
MREMPKVNPHSRFGRLVQWMAALPVFRKLFGPRLIPVVDRWLYKLTGGRLLLGALILDSLILTTVGRKSGEERTVPVAYFWVAEARVVVGTNFGREQHPAWALNLATTPKARIQESGENMAVVAELLDGDERTRVWDEVVAQWPLFTTYEQTMQGREAMLFRLQPM